MTTYQKLATLLITVLLSAAVPAAPASAVPFDPNTKWGQTP